MSLITYKSSAGSGKTSTLVIEYLAIALQKPNQFRQIIALTFTKKATAEMKNRLIESLISLKDMDIDKPDGSIDYIIKAIADKTKFDNAEIKSKSRILLTNILHNYGDFGFSTIDSFVVRIVRSFAHDLQLSSNFEIELDSTILIQNAIEQLNESIGKNEEITNFMIDFTMDQLDDEKSPDLDKPLTNLGRLIFDSKHYENIDSLKNVPLNNFVKIKDVLIKKVKEYDKVVSTIGKEGLDCLSKNGLEKKDCSRGWLWTYFNKLYTNHDQTRKIEELENVTFIGFVENGNDWYTKKQATAVIDRIESAQVEILKIIAKAREYYKAELPKNVAYKLILQKITPLALIHQLKLLIEANYEENDIIHLSEVNRKISEVVNEQHAPFIYERIGQRYNHFLIDEFQDTSVIQWNNMLPLIDNSLASNFRNLLVGDTKQSIYRWRDGEVEQFAQLPNLLNSNKSFITQQREDLIKSMYEEIILDYNYRSDENIVNFNNQLFSALLPMHNDYVSNYFKNHIQKTYKNHNTGVVKLINIPENKEAESKNDDLIKGIIENIIDLKENQNFDYGDICILARKNKFLSEVANTLIENNIKVVSSDALYLKSSNTINLIVNIMNIAIEKHTAINSYSALRYFYNQKNLGEPSSEHIAKESFFNHLNELGYDFKVDIIDNMDAYEISEYIISTMKIKNSSNPFVYSFLDRIIDLSKKKGASISLFLEYWEDNKDKLKIDLAGDKDSVQLLTIHKAKGLEFPVVIFPIIELEAKLEGRDMIWVNTNDDLKEQLPKALIGDYKYGLDSEFKEILNNELNKKQLDSLNMIYVACTRPTKQLQLFFTHNKHSKSYWDTCSAIKWDEERIRNHSDNILQLGELTKYVNKEVDNNNIKIDSFISSFWKDRIHLQRDINTNKAIRDKGSQLHNLLAETYSNTNVYALISYHLEHKLINKEYSEEFSEIITTLLIDEQTKDFFNSEYTHHNEKEILTANNNILRPDKVIIKTDEVIIIDYKYINYENISDNDMTKYKKQIAGYENIINQIHNKKIKSYLLFLSPIKVLNI